MTRRIQTLQKIDGMTFLNLSMDLAVDRSAAEL
jgi:hypothetical protein